MNTFKWFSKETYYMKIDVMGREWKAVCVHYTGVSTYYKGEHLLDKVLIEVKFYFIYELGNLYNIYHWVGTMFWHSMLAIQFIVKPLKLNRNKDDPRNVLFGIILYSKNQFHELKSTNSTYLT